MTEDALVRENNHSDRLPWPSAESAKAEPLGNNATVESSGAGIAHVAPSQGHWWHPCRYRDELLNTWLRVCNPISSRWQAWQNNKPPALEWYQIDESCRDPGILHGYRPEECTWSECVASIFAANNETFNVWSHILAFLYFVWRTIAFAKQWGYLDAEDKDFRHTGGDDHYCLAFISFMMTVCLVPLMSAIAHAFSALGPRAKAICFFMDYAAICNYGFGSALIHRAYVFPETWMTPIYTQLYLYAGAVASLASTFLTCCSRAFVTDVVIQRAMRSAAFAIPFLWVMIPLIIMLTPCWLGWGSLEYANTAKLHGYQIVAAFFGSFFYTTHIPERFFPGTFDLLGHSHNILHVLGVVATIFEIEGVLIDMDARREHLTSANLALLDFGWAAVSPLVVTIGHAVMLVLFSRYVYTHPESSDPQKHDKCKCH